MKPLQRRLVIVCLLLLAIASATYCLDYRSDNFYRIQGHFLARDRQDGVLFEAPVPVISFREKPYTDPLAELTPEELAFMKKVVGPPPRDPDEYRQYRVSISGLFPRSGMTFGAATIGGLLLPAILLVVAGFVALGGHRRTSVPVP